MAGLSTDTAASGGRWISAELVLPLGHFEIEHLKEAHPEKWEQLLHPDSHLTRAFLAEETVRLGGRGRHVVGRVFDGEEALSLTGFEGYFVGTCRWRYDPPLPGRKLGDLRTPEEIVLVIAYAGTLLLKHVERDLDTRYMTSHDTTAAEILRWVEAREMDEDLVRCLNGVYGGILGVMRANSNPALTAFHDKTYQLLVIPRLDVTASDDAIILRYRVPNAAPANPFTTRVKLDQRLRHGYDVMAAINPYMGNPVTRTYLQRDT